MELGVQELGWLEESKFIFGNKIKSKFYFMKVSILIYQCDRFRDVLFRFFFREGFVVLVIGIVYSSQFF